MSELKFIDLKALCEKLCISRKTYYEVVNPTSNIYDPDFPKPVDVFTGNKLRFSSIDVDNYILQHSHSHAA